MTTKARRPFWTAGLRASGRTSSIQQEPERDLARFLESQTAVQVLCRPAGQQVQHLRTRRAQPFDQVLGEAGPGPAEQFRLQDPERRSTGVQESPVDSGSPGQRRPAIQSPRPPPGGRQRLTRQDAEEPGPWWTGLFLLGGGKGTRTPNPLLAKQVRYQLRHAPEGVQLSWSVRVVSDGARESVAEPQTCLPCSFSRQARTPRTVTTPAARAANRMIGFMSCLPRTGRLDSGPRTRAWTVWSGRTKT